MLAACPRHMQLWILLCSDMAMRSGTAAIIGPEHYDPIRKVISFTTKMGEKLTLPTTDEIDALLADCDHSLPMPYVRQIWLRTDGRGLRRGKLPAVPAARLRVNFQTIRKSLGITRRIKPHDLRRTAAVAMLQHTKDVRDVQALLGHRSLQATIIYLDHDLRPIPRETLEALKKPFIVRKEKTA
jgi:integrase